MLVAAQLIVWSPAVIVLVVVYVVVNPGTVNICVPSNETIAASSAEEVIVYVPVVGIDTVKLPLYVEVYCESGLFQVPY